MAAYSTATWAWTTAMCCLIFVLQMSISTAVVLSPGLQRKTTQTASSEGRRSHSRRYTGSIASSLRSADNNTNFQVPRIIHQIYLSGEADYQQRLSEGRMKEHYRQSCVKLHPHWEHKVWARAEAESLIRDHYAWFWDTWESYTHWVRYPTC